VVVAQTKHVDSSAERHHVEVELELKTTRNNNMETHEPQAVLEHLSSSFLNRACGVLTVLTDLNEKWVFYWFNPDGKEIMKYNTDRKRAHFLLNNMIPNTSSNNCTSSDLPEHFWNRGNWETVEKVLIGTIKEEDNEDDEDDDDLISSNKKRNTEQNPSNESSDARDGKNGSNQGGDSVSSGITHGGSGHDGQQNGTLAQLFDYVGHDVCNEMDLLSMTDDEDERIRIVRRFLARHIVPGIVGAEISEVGIDCRTPPSDEIACPTLSESNVLRHNTASS
jgi:ribosomal protein L31E